MAPSALPDADAARLAGPRATWPDTRPLNMHPRCVFDKLPIVQLTKYTDLALRAVMRLAVADGSALLTTRQIADAMRVPYTHAAKAIAHLQHLGVVEARRGRGGGLALTGSGRSARVGELVRELEGDREAVTCEGANPCPLAGDCRLRHAFAQAQLAFYASLDRYTVEDLVDSPTGPVLLSLVGAHHP